MTMTSERKTLANRANSRASTGPKSAVGKSRAARNARHHGLSIPVSSDPKLSAEVKNAALEISGVDADPERRTLALAIAEPQIDLIRVRRARHDLMANIFENPGHQFARQIGLMRYVRALIKIDKLQEDGLHIPEELSRRVERPELSKRSTLVSSNMARSLAAMDRYERRALSRRNAAIRAFDAASRPQTEIPDLTDSGGSAL